MTERRRPTPAHLSAVVAGLTLCGLEPVLTRAQASLAAEATRSDGWGRVLAIMAGAVGAAAGGAVLGPSGVAAVGIGVAGLGMAIGARSPEIGALLVGFAIGVVDPAWVAVLARPFRAAHGMGLVALLFGTTLLLSVSPFLWSAPPAGVGPVLLAVGLGVALVDAAVQARAPGSADPGLRPVAVGSAAAAVLALVVTLSAVADPGFYEERPLLVEPAGWLCASLALLPVCVLLASLGGRVPPALIGGLGLVGTGAALAATSRFADGTTSGTVQGLVLLGLGAARATVWSTGRALCVRAVPWRASTAAVAVPFAASALATQALTGIASEPGRMAAAIAVVGLGLATVAVAGRADRWLLGEPR